MIPFIQKIKEYDMDDMLVRHPLQILFFEELQVKNRVLHWSNYEKVFTEMRIENYLADKLSFQDIVTAGDNDGIHLPHRKELLGKLKKRLRYFKNREEKGFSEEQKLVMRTLLEQDTFYFPLYDGSSVWKYHLVMIFTLIDWTPYVIKFVGGGSYDVALYIETSDAFMESNLEIVLPLKEMETLVTKLATIKKEDTNESGQWVQNSIQHHEEKRGSILKKLQIE